MTAYEIFINQFNELSIEFPKLVLVKNTKEIPIIKGVIDIIDHLGKHWETYEIEIHCTDVYPYRFPIVYEVSGKIPKIADWHIYEDSHSCCIKILPEELLICNKGITLLDFVKFQILPYLFNQTHRRVEGYYVNNGYSHGISGIFEFYSQHLNTTNVFQIIKILSYIYKGEEPDRVKMCFCGSNKKYRKCHRESFRTLIKLGREQLYKDITSIDANKQYFL
jgi:hypothetical protein